MKKGIILSLAVLAVAAIAFSVFVTVKAQTPTSTPPGTGGWRGGPGSCAEDNCQAPGLRLRDETGWMHDHMVEALAQQVKLPVEDVQKKLDAGQTLVEILKEAGVSDADLPAATREIRNAAIELAVADGDITREQADLMLERMDRQIGRMGGWGNFSGCPMYESGGHPMGRRGFGRGFNAQP